MVLPLAIACLAETVMSILLEPVSIEPMRSTDLDAVLRIDKSCFPAPWLPSAYLTELSNRSACYLVARVDSAVVGYGGQWVIMDEAHITTLAVAPSHRGQKIGERLLIALLEEAALQGAARATLEVRAGNVAAQRLYRKYGFYSAALRKSYYTDNGEDAIIMWADGIGAAEYRRRLRTARRALYESGDADPS